MVWARYGMCELPFNVPIVDKFLEFEPRVGINGLSSPVYGLFNLSK